MDYIGNLWKKVSENPKAPFASGVVDFMGRKIRITVWDNSKRKREGKKDPDFSITLDEPREGKPPSPGNNSDEQYAEHKAKQELAGPHYDHGEKKPAPQDFRDDIPF